MLELFAQTCYVGGPESAQVDAVLKQDTIFASIKPAGAIHGRAVCHFYLLRDGNILDKVFDLPKPSYQWKLTQSGIYTVQGYIRYMGVSVFQFSKTIEYFTQDAVIAYKSFLKEPVCTEGLLGQELELDIRKPPFHDFVLCSFAITPAPSGSSSHSLHRGIEHFLASRPEFKAISLGNLGGYDNFLISDATLRSSITGQYLFSGITFWNGKPVEGEADLPEHLAVNGLHGSTGAFTLIDINADNIQVSNDFFNLEHLIGPALSDVSKRIPFQFLDSLLHQLSFRNTASVQNVVPYSSYDVTAFPKHQVTA